MQGFQLSVTDWLTPALAACGFHSAAAQHE